MLSILGTVLLVRLISEHDYGVYSLFYSIISQFALFASFGLVNTLQRYIPEYYANGEFIIAHRLYRMASMIRLLSNILLLCMILLFWDSLSPLLKIEAYKNYFILFSFILVFHFQWGLMETCLSSYFLHQYTQTMASLFTLLKLIGYCFVLFTDKILWAVLVVELIAYAVLFTGLQIVYRNKIPVDAGKLNSFSAQERKRLVRYAFFYNFNDAGSSILAPDFDNFIIAMYMNPIAVGAYAFCQRITKMLQHMFPVTYLIEVIRPAFFSLGLDAGQAQRTLMFQLLIKITYITTIPLFIGVVLLGQDMIELFFGGKFIEYSPVLSTIFFVAVLNAFQTPLGLAAMLKERADIMLYSKIFAFYNIAADILLIPVLGIWGAVLATGTATLGKNLFVWFFVRREASFSGMTGFFTALIAFWTITGAFIWGLDRFFELNSLGQFVTGSLLISFGFLLQFRMGLFTKNESGILQSAFSKYAYLRPALKFLKV